MSLPHIIIFTLLAACSSVSLAFRLRRSDITGYRHPYYLRNEIGDNGRPRTIEYRKVRENNILDDDAYFSPNSELDHIVNQNSLHPSYVPEYGNSKSHPLFSSSEEYPYLYSGYDEPSNGLKKRTAYNPHRIVPTTDELRTLFGKTDVPVKHVTPVKRQEPNVKVLSTDHESIDNIDNNIVDKEFTNETITGTMRNLVNAAEKLITDAAKLNDKGKSKTTEERIVVEGSPEGDTEILDQVFSETKTLVDMNKDQNNLESDYHNSDALPSSDIDDNSERQALSKRASSGTENAEYVLQLLQKISELKKKLSKFETLQMLEDRENDFLANALKYSTLDQMQRKDGYIEQEYNQIAKATEIESMIQQLTQGEDNKQDDYKQENDKQNDDKQDEYFGKLLKPIVNDDDMADKRSDGSHMLDEHWYDDPVTENVGVGAMLESSEEDSDIKQETQPSESNFETAIPFEEEKEVNADDELEDFDENDFNEDGDNDNVPTGIDDLTTKQAFAKPNIARILKKLSPGEVKNIIAELKHGDGDELDSGMCPAVNDLSKNCAFADVQGIPINDDARLLCIKHQICYACGSILGISQNTCDDGYESTVIQACYGNHKCLRDAEVFLQLMERAHEYKLYSPAKCAMSCVENFIYNGY